MKVALVCGGGAFPLALIESLQAQNTPFFLLLIKDYANEQLRRYPHEIVSLAHFSKLISLAKANGCEKICFLGTLTRPSLFAALPNLKTLLMLPQIIKAFKGGDNHLLTSLAKLFENNGLALIGAHEIAPQLLAPKGVWGKVQPAAQDIKDCELGLKAIQVIGQYDIGQALVISHSHIVAVEGIEGTDGLLARVKDYRMNGRLNWHEKRGILIKAMKPNQESRLDMPAIGGDTITNAANAGLKGIAVEAEKTLVMDIQAVIREADKHGLFVMAL